MNAHQCNLCTNVDVNAPNDSLELLNIDVNDLLFTNKSFPDLDLKTLLQTSPMGKSVLNLYEAHKMLDNTKRTRLVDIIIKHLYTYITNKYVNNTKITNLN